jgi:hypothetical protein
MKTRTFEVPRVMIAPFLAHEDENDIETSIIDLYDDESLEIEVSYDEDQRDEVMTLIEMLDEYENENDDDDDD